MQRSLPNYASSTKRHSRAKLAQLHSNPFPIGVYQLPAFLPHNPISIFRLIYALISSFLLSTSSHPAPLPTAYLCDESRTIHVTESSTIQFLWNSGFFGKGNLSRSEPTWTERERQRLGLSSIDVSEEVTRRRREERREFKRDRARRERDFIERVRLNNNIATLNTESTVSPRSEPQRNLEEGSTVHKDRLLQENGMAIVESSPSLSVSLPVDLRTHNMREIPETSYNREILVDKNRTDNVLSETQEHLQLTLEEGFFLAYGLNALSVRDGLMYLPVTNEELLLRCCDRSASMKNKLEHIKPDNSFLISYVVYHHLRSLGWVVRSGIKFSVDYLLYNRGPPFAHAEFAVNIIRDYRDPYWTESDSNEKKMLQQPSKPWHWLHSVNRVQSQVLKSLVFIYVYIPPPIQNSTRFSTIADLLERYELKEFVWRRWIPNRNRD